MGNFSAVFCRSLCLFLGALMVAALVATPMGATQAPAPPTVAGQSQGVDAGWPGFRGATADGTTGARAFSDAGIGLEVAWKRPIGTGYSGVSVGNGKIVTMFVDGEEDVIAAYDPANGEELWKFPIGPTYIGHDGSFDGPMSTPLIHGTLVIGLSGWGRLFALDMLAGEPVWSTDLVEDHGAVLPEYGFATSPLLHDGTLVVQIGAPDATIAGFDPATGALRWKSGSDAVAYQSPVSMNVGGRSQLVAAGMTELFGLDSASGEVLWSFAHGGTGYLGVESLVPVAAGVDRVFLAYKDESSTVVALDPGSPTGSGQPLWEDRTIRNSYAVAVYRDGYVYGFSSRFLTAVDVATGKAAWKSRPPGDGFPILVDGHLIILTKDGSVHVVEATPQAYNEKAGIQVFDDLAWSPPSFAMGSIFVRSMGEIARVEVRNGARMDGGVIYEAGMAPEGSAFAGFLAEINEASDKPAVIDEYLGKFESFPIIEGNTLAHFVYRGEGDDLAIAGDMIGSRQEARMRHLEGTDLFYYSVSLQPDTRLNYRFIRDYEEILDPRNPRQTISSVYGPDMAMADPGVTSAMSWMAMPAWQPPTHLAEPAAGATRGRIVEQSFESELFEGPQSIQVYLPAGYDEGDGRYPVAYFHGGFAAVPLGRVPGSLDNLIGGDVSPVIGVFINVAPEDAIPPQYAQVFAEELVPFVDANYRTVAAPEGRASVGQGWFSYPALYAAFAHPGVVGKVGVQSVFMLDFMRIPLEELISSASEQPLELYVDWGAFDLRNPQEAWDIRDTSRQFVEFLRGRGYAVAGGEAPDGTGWDSWRNRTDVLLKALFPG